MISLLKTSIKTAITVLADVILVPGAAWRLRRGIDSHILPAHVLLSLLLLPRYHRRRAFTKVKFLFKPVLSAFMLAQTMPFLRKARGKGRFAPPACELVVRLPLEMARFACGSFLLRGAFRFRAGLHMNDIWLLGLLGDKRRNSGLRFVRHLCYSEYVFGDGALLG